MEGITKLTIEQGKILMEFIQAQLEERDTLLALVHEREMHPDYEYTTTKGPRKAWDGEPDLTKEGWTLNIYRGREGWERFDYHEEKYWYKKKEDLTR